MSVKKCHVAELWERCHTGAYRQLTRPYYKAQYVRKIVSSIVPQQKFAIMSVFVTIARIDGMSAMQSIDFRYVGIKSLYLVLLIIDGFVEGFKLEIHVFRDQVSFCIF